MDQLPFFVYGTLLPNQPNEGYWEDQIIRSTPAVLHSAELYAFPNFPMMITSQKQDSHVIGQINWIHQEGYGRILSELDFLENYNPADHHNSPYQRVKRLVQAADGDSIEAWTYIGQPILVKGLPLIPNGDWKKYMANRVDSLSNDTWWRNRSSDKLF